MAKRIFKYGEIVQAPYVLPHPTKRNEYTAEMREGVVSGFSHPQFSRDWGWRGDMLVKFPDGKHVWIPLN